MVVEADDEHVYTMNTELSAYSRVDGKLKWSVRLPVAGGGLSIVLSGDSAYAATQRGIFQVNRHNGKVLRVVRTAETNSPGMGMRLIGDKLVTISSNSVTCYLLKPAADAPSK
jgi:outer membrane protein assembly factor BamB